MQKMRRKSFFETRFELLGWEIGKNDGQKNSSAYLPDLPSPPGCYGVVVLVARERNMTSWWLRIVLTTDSDYSGQK